ncbi:antibiotic ABC transporter ATP-binding protein [Streptomyces sp. G44]|uniref:antibiotic ABC transporter ATP-binding protein n=1 Tax=Streptomyces sp. G44 TaxID=2807632 RepID=UPI00195FAC12|nr:antibiotic ABC transporter ATP-binding protein [Streptomyces sp. G44]MBM7169450.1 antibiotic ABC transporter ATP-binding protein [Streptomyces sp. G44]
MARIVVVHGIAQQFKGPRTLHASVAPALRDGVTAALGAAGPALGDDDIACAFYGDAFVRPGTRATAVPAYDEADVEPGFEAELLLEWWLEAARVYPQVLGPDARSRGVVGYVAARPLTRPLVRRALDALTHAPYFARVAEPLLIFGLKQVRRYFNDPALRERVRASVARAIDADTRVLVAHSLGSVVAYELLCDEALREAHPEWQISSLITLGSPLGLRGLVFDRLIPAPHRETGSWPPRIRRWTNVADRGDIVALVKRLAPRFGPEVADHEVDNGAEMHSMSRYLTAPVTGRAVAEALTR